MSALITSIIARCLVAIATIVACLLMFLYGIEFAFILFMAFVGMCLTAMCPKYEINKKWSNWK